jgi:hypothetical protein
MRGCHTPLQIEDQQADILEEQIVLQECHSVLDRAFATTTPGVPLNQKLLQTLPSSIPYVPYDQPQPHQHILGLFPTHRPVPQAYRNDQQIEDLSHTLIELPNLTPQPALVPVPNHISVEEQIIAEPAFEPKSSNHKHHVHENLSMNQSIEQLHQQIEVMKGQSMHFPEQSQQRLQLETVQSMHAYHTANGAFVQRNLNNTPFELGGAKYPGPPIITHLPSHTDVTPSTHVHLSPDFGMWVKAETDPFPPPSPPLLSSDPPPQSASEVVGKDVDGAWTEYVLQLSARERNVHIKSNMFSPEDAKSLKSASRRYKQAKAQRRYMAEIQKTDDGCTLTATAARSIRSKEGVARGPNKTTKSSTPLTPNIAMAVKGVL